MNTSKEKNHIYYIILIYTYIHVFRMLQYNQTSEMSKWTEV